jgi:hypothetical protein
MISHRLQTKLPLCSRFFIENCFPPLMRHSTHTHSYTYTLSFNIHSIKCDKELLKTDNSITLRESSEHQRWEKIIFVHDFN